VRLPRLLLVAALVALLVVLVANLSGATGTASRSAPARRSGPARPAPAHPARTTALPFPSGPGTGMAPGPNLASGSDPAVLPSDVLIADEGNNRLVIVNPAGAVVWEFPQPGDLLPGQQFSSPDDAFFTPNGQDIIATQENDQVVSLISVARHRILWQYGTPGVPGHTANHLDNPDDAMMLPNGDVVLADIKNCSLLVLHVGSHIPLERLGMQDTYCDHAPPLRWGSPNGVFPLTDHHWLVTEINGDWVDEITFSGQVLWSTHPPGVAYPSDTNEVRPGVFITADYSDPGQVVEFDSSGRLLWRYGPTSGPGMLNTPSLCEPIPTNGDILCNDDSNDRVIVIDPRTNTIVWQYGRTGVAGSGPGELAQPDGVDLAPPYSLLVRAAPTMGTPTLSCIAGLPPGTCTFGAAAAGG